MAAHTDPPPVEVAFLRGVSVFDAVLARVPADRWDARSPCDGWTARDVVGHVVGTVTKGLEVLAGADYPARTSHPEDVDDPVARWPQVRDRVREALRTAALDREIDAADGPRTVGEGLRFPAADLAVHAWDLATATGQRLQLPAELLAHIAATCERVPQDALRGPGRFGPARTAPPGADATTALMAWLGREAGS